jgi:membrane-associated protein
MEIANSFFELFLNLDKHLFSLVAEYKNWTYLILFCIIFCETGLVVTPFLPGDSLLFAAGTMAALGIFNIWILIGLLSIAAILGDSINYSLGKFLGHKVFERNYRLIKKEHLYRTHGFYEKHGGKTIIIARFVPIIRTFAPFIAGVGSMKYVRFISFNIAGGILWIFICSFGGYFFGNLPFVKNNFSVVVLTIILISLLPMVVEYIKYKLKPGQNIKI